ncbi:MAG: aminopeptidase P family protein [Chloroflexota bacterium]
MNDTIYHDRLAMIRQKLANWGVDGLYITGDTNRRWASGFTGSSGQLLITQTQALLATDFRYWEQAQRESPAFELFKHQRTDAETKKLLETAVITTIGLEAKEITLFDANKLKELAPKISWVPLENSLAEMRQVKTAVEVEALRAAAAITDYAMAQVNEIAQVGMTERALAWELEKIMRERGADGLAFDIIVASGPNSALPHYHPADRKLQEGDAIVIDMGCQLNGYRSDLTRSFHLGSTPSDKFWEIYNLTLRAQQVAIAQIRPGMTLLEADATARTIITEGGYGEQFGHGLGHGVGLDIHEEPFMSVRAEPDDTLVVGVALTIEPGIYIPGWGGVRIEDFMHVTDEGNNYISQCPKNPIIPT